MHEMITRSMERFLQKEAARKLAQRTAEDARALVAAAQQSRKLHLACGPNLMDGWINVDIEARPGAFRWDLRRPLPFAGGSMDVIFAEHFIEHITLDEGEILMRDCHRILRPGGVGRLSTPDLEYLVGQYQADRVNEWIDMGFQPNTRCRMVNEGMRNWGHQFVYDQPELQAMLMRAGFGTVRNCKWRESTVPALVGVECRNHHHELIVEAVRS